MTDSNADSKPSISLAPNGPCIVKNLATFTGVDGAAIETKPVLALCRCGKSGARPFCDGTHAKVGFTGDRQDDRVADQRDSYAGDKITVHDNRGICSHAASCSEMQPKVFRGGVEPWIDPNGADPAAIDEIVRVCPSGALASTKGDVEHLDQDRAPAIGIMRHGPFAIEGGIELEGVDWLEGASREHYVLCRCGHSKNKPFCDGTHWYAKYRDDDLYRVAMLGELEGGASLSVEVEGVELAVSKDGDGAAVETKSGETSFTVTIDDRWGEVFVDRNEVRQHASDS